mmetsp:Transcript_35732/g.102936  ORF Transcript_35732/g.102936 Transcript_35732/m.102936 type:complete len:255 (-) Transcript_35732:45-809(-)
MVLVSTSSWKGIGHTSRGNVYPATSSFGFCFSAIDDLGFSAVSVKSVWPKVWSKQAAKRILSSMGTQGSRRLMATLPMCAPSSLASTKAILRTCGEAKLQDRKSHNWSRLVVGATAEAASSSLGCEMVAKMRGPRLRSSTDSVTFVVFTWLFKKSDDKWLHDVTSFSAFRNSCAQRIDPCFVSNTRLSTWAISGARSGRSRLVVESEAQFTRGCSMSSTRSMHGQPELSHNFVARSSRVKDGGTYGGCALQKHS